MLVKYTDLPKDLPHQELPLPEVCWLFTGVLLGHTDVLLKDTRDLSSPGLRAHPPAQLWKGQPLCKMQGCDGDSVTHWDKQSQWASTGAV